MTKVSESMSENMRKSLTDMGPRVVGRRNRSESDDRIELPPLPDDEDNKDLLEEPQHNYASNGSSNIFSHLAADDSEEFGSALATDQATLSSKFRGMFDDEFLDNEGIGSQQEYNTMFDRMEMLDDDN